MSGWSEEAAPRQGEYLEGEEHVIEAVQEATKDNRDGTAILSFNVAADAIPPALAASPDGGMWRLRIPAPEGTGSMDVTTVRYGVHDRPKGRALLKFQVAPSGLPPSALWGRSGMPLPLSLRMLAGRHPFPHFVQRHERAGAQRRASMACREPGFAAWLAARCEAEGLGRVEAPDLDEELGVDAAMAQALAADECLRRVARIHSRREILTSNLAAERVESLLRGYREHLWQRGRPAREADEEARGLGRRA